MKNKLIILLLSLISYITVHSQTSIMYTTEGDISSSLINNIYQDKKGFIWISTEYGLNVFDGYRFNLYKHEEKDSTSICNNYARVTFEDTKGNIWVGTVAGMMKFNKGKKSFNKVSLYANGEEIIPHVSQIIERSNGEIWIATSNQGIFCIDASGISGNRIQNTFGKTTRTNCMVESTDGTVYIGTEDEGLISYSADKKIAEGIEIPGLKNANISSMVLESNDNLYLGTFSNGLYIYNIKTGKVSKPQNGNNLPIKVISLINNTLYIGTDGNGLKVYSEKSNTLEDFKSEDPVINMNNSKVHSILSDKDGNMWLGIFQKGVLFIPKKKYPFRLYGEKMLVNSPIGEGCVMSIHKDSENNTLVGIDSKGLYLLDSKYRQIRHYSSQDNSSTIPYTILSIFEDSQKNIWLGGYLGGVCIFNKTTGKCNYINELKHQSVFSITEDLHKNIYISTYSAGLYVYNLETKELTSYKNKKENSQDEIPDNWINTLYCDKEGYIWIGHFKGVSCYNPETKSFKNFTSTNYIIKDKMCYSITEGKDGNIWIGTSEGLYSFNKNNNTIKRYTEDDGLSNIVICGICEDNESNLWISTFNGLNKLNTSNNSIVNYYSEDGLQGNEFTRGAVYKSGNGDLLFGGTNGFTCFNPSAIKDIQTKPQITVTDFQIYGQSINTTSKSGNRFIIEQDITETSSFNLSHRDNTFRVLFSTMNFVNTSQVQYKYRIKELDKAWLYTRKGENYITFNSLNSGRYTLEVIATNRSVESDIYSFDIYIAYPWYQMWWAYILYSIPVIIMILLTINYIRTRIRRRQDYMEIKHAREINEAKLQFFINISHEIRTPMTLIINPLEKLMASNPDKETGKTYTMIYRNAQRIIRLINQLMDMRKIEKGQMQMHFRETDMVGFINDLMMTFDITARQKKIDFKFIHSNPSEMAWIDINNFDKVLMNLLSNAFKYTPDNGKVYITLSKGENTEVRTPLRNYIEIKVTDSGIGLDEEQKERIFERFYQISGSGIHNQGGTGVGLHLTRSLVEMHYGTITAENNTDSCGSTFTVRIPAGCDHISLEQIDNSKEEENIVNTSTTAQFINTVPDNESDEVHPKKKTKTNFNILIVDDEKEIQEYLREELSDEYRISLASNGREAYEHLLTNNVDLVISDVMMDEMDGLTLCKRIRQNPNINHIPVVLLTAKGKTEEQIEGIEIGADAYIIKPFNTDVLRSTISNLLQNRRVLKNKFSGAQEQKEKVKNIEMKSQDEALMEKVMSIINKNMAEPTLNVEMLAQEVGISRVHLHRKLKELTSLSTRDFIKNIRMQQAAKLLKDKKFSISDVAYAVGYSNLSHFSSTFKEIFGVSPKDYTHDSSKEEEKANTDSEE